MRCVTYAEYLAQHPIPFSGTVLPTVQRKSRGMNPKIKVERPEKVAARVEKAIKKATKVVRPMDNTDERQATRNELYIEKLIAAYSVMDGKGWLSVPQIERLTGLVGSSTFRHLRTLVKMRYVRDQRRNRRADPSKVSHRVFMWRGKKCPAIE